MLFNSYIFIFLFLPVVFAGYLAFRRNAQSNGWVIWLVVASLVYYAWWKPAFVLLLLLSIAVNAVVGEALCSGRLSRSVSRWLLIAGVVFNLLLLGYFKYAIFLVENLNQLGAELPVPQVILPIGISFITFQKIAFLVDAHRGAVKNYSLRNFLLFVTFFPQLIAGPIVHHAEMMPQFEQHPAKQAWRENLAVGLSIFCIGLFKKVMIADSFAPYADAGFDAIKAGNALDYREAWVAVLAYSFQLYFDFSGYSDMAVGLARLFGIKMPVNFHSPYKATGIIDFWRRWHMTLSRFLRDYLYIPLGGSQHGALRRNLNLAVVMVLGGLWHGANWTFIVWGVIHGVLLGLNHSWNQLAMSRRRVFQTQAARHGFMLLTFIVVTLAWVPFRSDSLATAWEMLLCLSGNGAASLTLGAAQLKSGAWLLLIAAAVTFIAPNTHQLFGQFKPVSGLSTADLHSKYALTRLDWKVSFVVAGAFVISVLNMSRVSPFLYFQF